MTYDLHTVRRAYPLLAEMAYFNTGTYGLMAEPVLARYLDDVATFERRGMAAREADLRGGIEQSRASLAKHLNCTPSEVTLTGNATDGVAYTTAGLTWHEGDEVIISDQEHPAMSYPWQYTGQRYGMTIKRYHISDDSQESLANVKALITDRTRLIGTSHVTSPTGIRTPAKEICALAHQHGALAFVDGAQSFGVTAIDVQVIGCDFFSGNVHKWLGGPKGSGFLFARQHLMEQLAPAYVGAGALEHFGTNGDLTLQPNGKRFEYGTRGFAVHAGIRYALDWQESLGWCAVSDHIAAASTRLKGKLAQLPDVQVITPQSFEQSSGLVSFRVVDRDETALQQAFERERLYPRTLGKGSQKIRVSTALFNSDAEIDALVDVVTRFVKQA